MDKNNSIKIEDLFTQKQSEEGMWSNLNIPGNLDAVVRLKLIGTDSAVFKAAAIKQNQDELAYENKNPKLDHNSEKEINRRKLAECKLLSSLIVDWEGFEEKFSKKSAFELLKNAPFVARHVDNFSAQSENFIKAPSKK